MYGGTGSASASEEQPSMLPDKLESGTPNGVGIAGLGAGVDWVLRTGVDKIRRHHDEILGVLVSGLAEIPGVTVYGPESHEHRAGLVSFRVEGHQSSEVGLALDEEYGIMCRAGLHCAPAAHKTIGTFPEGTVRFGIGPMTIESEIEKSLAAIQEIARR